MKKGYKNHYIFKKNRNEKLKLVGHRCEDCEISLPSRKLMAHHIDLSKDNHSIDNLKILCCKCHFNNYHQGEQGRPTKYGNFTIKEVAIYAGCNEETVRKYLKYETRSKQFQSKIDTFLKNIDTEHDV